eukprot:jgi/Chlat1/7563/Chrsp63S00556
MGPHIMDANGCEGVNGVGMGGEKAHINNTAPGLGADVLTPQLSEAGKCPFLHGSVSCSPYPGYVHGRHPEVCPNGCRPDASVGKGETKKQTLLREAKEFQILYHRELKLSAETESRRWAAIAQEIETTGTYTHTLEELEHGARVAWRNAPKCSNRKFWSELTLLDRRDVTTAQGMHTACLDMLETATLHGATEVYISVFPPTHPITGEGGPRIWNTQLMRYAGWRLEDGSLYGDPAEVKFTELVTRKFGWKPASGKPSRFDILPLVLQADPRQAPVMLDVPPQYVSEYPWFAELGYRWYGLPAVSNMELSLGGIMYTAAPFIGWYADTEIVRNLSDESRYNTLPEIGKLLGYSITENSNLWRDAALVTLNQAVNYSFRQASTGIVDHHTLMQQFWEWHNKEKQSRGYNPGNWKWIISPVAASTSRCYLGLNKMTEYTLKPAYLYTPGFAKYAQQWFGDRWDLSELPLRPVTTNPYVIKMLGRMQTIAHSFSAKPRILIVYATVSGTAKDYASRTAQMLKSEFQVILLDVENFQPEDHHPDTYHLLIIISSTYGAGSPPASAFRFLRWLTLQGCCFSVFGIGSSSYPRFCAAADTIHAMMLASGAKPLGNPGKGDAIGGRDMAFKDWLTATMQSFRDHLTTAGGMEKCDRVINLIQDTAVTTFQQIYNLLAHDTRWLVAPITEVAEVLPPEAQTEGRSVCLVKIDLSDIPTALYAPGDHIAVLPTNHQLSNAELETLAEHLGIEDLDGVFDLEVLDEDGALEAGFNGKKFPLPNTFRVILDEHVALMSPVAAAALPVLAQYAGTDADAHELAELGRSEHAAETWQAHSQVRWADLFQEFPSLSGRVPFEVFLQLAPALYPRYYSIASSNWGRLPSGQSRLGQCSSYLVHARAGSYVRFRLTKVTSFRQPMKTSSPIIMVAAGTGIAPFLGFIQHRIQLGRQGNMGPCILVFGCRTQADRLCWEEVERGQACGALSEVILAYSREPGRRKHYVQDVIMAEKKKLTALLKAPDAHIYVCGDSHMASAVSSAFTSIIGTEAMTSMTVECRFHEDVFGVVLKSADRLSVARHIAADRNGHRPILKAALANDLAEVSRLLVEGADITAADSDANSLLHIAAEIGSSELTRLLLQYNAPLKSVNNWNLTPAALAQVRGQPDIRDAIIEAGGTLASGMHRYIKRLLAQNADPWTADYYGCTPLRMAAMTGNLDTLWTLLQAPDAAGIVNAVDRYGHTALAAALAFQQYSAANMLKPVGARITASSTNFTAWPSLSHWSPSNSRTLWGAIASNSFPEETTAALTSAGVMLFNNLFEMSPHVLDLFPFKDDTGKPFQQVLEAHALQVMTTLGRVVEGLNDIETLVPFLRDLTARHVPYGVELVHYDILSATLLRTFEQTLGNLFTPEDRDVWQAMFDIIGSVAREAYPH